MIVADTDVLIDALAGREPARSRIAQELERGTLATTTITVFELVCGATSDRVRQRIDDLLAALTLLPPDAAAARAAAAVRRRLDAAGAPIGMADYLIAGVCRSRSAALLTLNRARFARVPDLELARLE